jgi:hypothetical protein
MSVDPQASEAPAGEPTEDDTPRVTSASGIANERLLPAAEPAPATSFLADFVERAPVENEGQRQANGKTCMNSSVLGLGRAPLARICVGYRVVFDKHGPQQAARSL